MFGKKKEKAIKVMHYEGIEGFAANYPCTMEVTDDLLTIKRIKPESTVTLPMNRIQSFTALDEKNFMQKFKGTEEATSKSTPKYYLVIQYDKGQLVFWGTAMESKSFIDLQYKYSTTPSSIEL